MTDNDVEAVFSWRREGRSPIGRERIDLLEALGAHGSITQAARAVGLSYKAAWDALNTINNLLPSPAFEAKTGGRHGGGAHLTEQGRALILSFRLLEQRLNRATRLMSDVGAGPVDPMALLLSLGFRTSARNAFRCTVHDVRRGPVSAEVIMRLSADCMLTAIITSESVETLGITRDRDVVALIKSSLVMLACPGGSQKVSARNLVPGIVTHREDGPVNSEFQLDIGGGRTLTSVITGEGADELNLTIGDPAIAVFNATHVILAVD